jgi:hypothetical protein
MAELSLTKVYKRIETLVKNRLKLQVPVGETEKLKKSITVRVEETSGGIKLIEGYLTYGIFLKSGTGRYFKPNPKAGWNPNPGKGKGGIKPRYWTNLDKATTTMISQLLKKDVKIQIQTQLKNYK